METVNCSILVADDAKKLEVVFAGQSKVVIDLAGDIDFTPLVEKLAELFPIAEKIVLDSVPKEADDKKMNLVISTTVSFVEKYNLVQNPVEPEFDPENIFG